MLTFFEIVKKINSEPVVSFQVLPGFYVFKKPTISRSSATPYMNVLAYTQNKLLEHPRVCCFHLNLSILYNFSWFLLSSTDFFKAKSFFFPKTSLGTL